MTENRLASSTSPYLLQHKDNPVHWYPWGPEALAAAKAENKPILLSVGYAACHWCHVMAHESFEDASTADVMNRLFINIKVDREERPDIDQIYMKALHALGEQGGWPLTMFLTSDGEPFWGGTYYPKEAKWGHPAFVDMLEAVSRTYHTDRDRIETNRSGLLEALKTEITPTAPIDRSLMMAAGERLLSLYDPEHGGIKGAPKFPQASILDLLWRTGLRAGNDKAKETFLHTLRQISNGGIYDHLKGGIARYSVDHLWLVPHFEKMLYDNGQYLDHLATAYLATGEDLFRNRIEETVDWLLDEMRMEGGAFAASLDADSEGVEGKFYVWTAEEITEVLGEEDAALFAKAYDVSPSGNWEGVTILNRLKTPSLSAKEEARLARLRKKLLGRRSSRIRPGLDDKILADWNGLTIASLARAARFVSRESCLEPAKAAYGFIMETMIRDGRLGHSWRKGRLLLPGFASDYANMMNAALALAEACPDDAMTYIADAEKLGKALVEGYQTNEGAFYLTASDAEGLIVRPVTSADEATPNPNSMAALTFAKLYILTGKTEYRDLADKVLIALSSDIPKNVFATASLLTAFDTRTNGRLAVIVAPSGTDPNPFLKVLSKAVDPALHCLVLESTEDLPDDHPAKGKNALENKPTVYLCREGACSFPITRRKDLEEALTVIA
ncbi:thioredoxin domain-containing protein [uncultured Roseibium sp.]|uniref:thioredoxin domain-containing protein n=1 Tax=uncultured Roseibium sp. TaxID=1936171 RepID=UPI003216B423